MPSARLSVAGLYIEGSTTFAGYRRLLEGNLARFDELAAELADQLPGGHSREIAATLGTSLQQLGRRGAWRSCDRTEGLDANLIVRARHARHPNQPREIGDDLCRALVDIVEQPGPPAIRVWEGGLS
jgi:hypothetical protein